MYQDMFSQFLQSGDSLHVYEGGNLVFASHKDGVLPLLDYLSTQPERKNVVIFDSVMGNAAALLAVKAGGQEVFSPLGSQVAIGTLDKYHIRYHITETVPHILRADGKDMCPMEKLSLGKDPEEFYLAVKKFLKV
jgi:hypothetical protein